ncbi:GreA/GreB family elongation factor [Salegentibacter flavus]|uniref:Regulator of nucleoside diphosphate kinase n=1 Tax=Salegentibacter flavus TaxID=287099 RepID=A0A1I5B7C2_9FLAO|nr:GreA/GreB family elongation factor [Salegentibacter flavus]SFN70520.1 regulator of nucleoside diphosphate kinase [Salegentibacter flavus]
MKYGVIIIEKKEKELLNRIISMAQYYKDENYKISILKLSEELKNARFLSNKEMPEDVVRFNSVVSISTPFSVSREYQIVSPEKSDIRQNKISILAPMGLALFGYAKGDTLKWNFPTGENIISIDDVRQQVVKLETKNNDR